MVAVVLRESVDTLGGRYAAGTRFEAKLSADVATCSDSAGVTRISHLSVDRLENKLEDFATLDGDPAFEFSDKDSDALGLAIVENVKRLFPGLNRRYRIDATKDVSIRIVNDGGTWEYAQPAAVPAGESA